MYFNFARNFALASVSFCLVHANVAWASACCGGGAQAAQLILNDDRSVFSVGMNLSNVVGDAPASGLSVMRASEDSEWIQTVSIEAAAYFSDRAQGGIKIPVSRRARNFNSVGASHVGLGDIGLVAGYEFLPEFEYSSWRPRGIVSFHVTLPTGKSILEADRLYLVDTHGAGNFKLGLGVTLVKNWQVWDALFKVLVEKPFARTIELPGNAGAVELDPTVDWSITTGAGILLGETRIGLNLQPQYNGASSNGSYKLVWNSSLDFSIPVLANSIFQMSYLDQTLMGPAKNTTLERSFQLSLRLRQER